jgi:hypothetical protein
MKDGAPFGLAGIWENWKEPASGEWIRTFAIITTDANELMAEGIQPGLLRPQRPVRHRSQPAPPCSIARRQLKDLAIGIPSPPSAGQT